MNLTIRDFYTMNVKSFVKRLWLNLLSSLVGRTPWEDTARHYARGTDYWHKRAKCAEALLTGETTERCKHRLSLGDYFFYRELYCDMPPHSGGFHGALGLRWDDAGKIKEGQLVEEPV